MQEQAEQLLQTRSLCSYYDSVARKGLELAASDILRGALSPAHIVRLREDLTTLIDELESYEDVDPPHRLNMPDGGVSGVERPNRVVSKQPAPDVAAPADTAGAGPPARPLALCVSGRGPLDDVPGAMLAQLLRKHGFETRTVSFEETSRAHIGALETAGVALVCVSFLEILGQPPNFRYLLRRLRSRLPQAPVVVGLWAADDRVLVDKDLRQMMGADAYAGSLREMVIQSVELVSAPAEGAIGVRA